jgi:transposase
MSKRAIAKKFGVSRNTVDKYCSGDSVPWKRRDYIRPSTIINDDVELFIEQCIEQDALEGVRKQKHTAKRIYDRLVEECAFIGGESTIRRKVRTMKERIPEAFVPLEYDPGEALQIDWGVGVIYLKGKKHKVNLFCARLCKSEASIVFAFERQNEESFLEGLCKVFSFFKGVTRRVMFDNAKIAVKEGFGTHAVVQKRYGMLAAHYGFETVFCNPASGNEKGLVEGLVGWCRRNILVPIPHVDVLSDLDGLLLRRCVKYLDHTVRGKNASMGELLCLERESLLSLPGYQFDTSRSTQARVDSYCTVRFDTNNYSVPVAHCGHGVSVKGYGNEVKVYYRGIEIAAHTRCYEKQQTIYDLAHYLPLLERKPRSLLNAKPVRNNLPPEMLSWMSGLSAKEVMAVLRLCADMGIDVVEKARRNGIPLHSLREETPAPAQINDRISVKPTDLGAYDRILERGVAL